MEGIKTHGERGLHLHGTELQSIEICVGVLRDQMEEGVKWMWIQIGRKSRWLKRKAPVRSDAC